MANHRKRVPGPIQAQVQAKAQEQPRQAVKRSPRLGRGLSSLMAQAVQVDPPPSPEVKAPLLRMEKGAPAQEGGGGGLSVEAVARRDTHDGAEAAAPGSVTQDGRSQRGLVMLGLDTIRPNARQPRQQINPRSLERLAGSIREDGLIQPIVVRPLPDAVGSGVESGVGGDASPSKGDRYELVAGERRWRAARLAGLEKVPAVVQDLDDRQVAEWALIENLQREDLNPMERAEAFQRLADEFGMSHDQIADRVGLERPTVSNILRLLNLCDDARGMVRDGLISGGQARALVGLADADQQSLLAKQAAAGGWSVRRVEQAVRRLCRDSLGGEGSEGTQGRVKPGVDHLKDLEQHICQQLQTKVRLRPGRRKGSGALVIEFYDLEQFDALMERLGVRAD